MGAVFDARLTRTGVFPYRLPDGSIRRELRHPDDVLSQDSLETLKLLPVTREHPTQPVTADTVQELAVGWVGDSLEVDDGHVRASLHLTAKQALSDVDRGHRRQLSCGYVCDVVDEQGEYNGERYDARQTNIRYNHVALVRAGRAGREVALRADSAEEIDPEDNPQSQTPSGDGAGMEKELEELKARLDSLTAQLEETNAKLVTSEARADALEAEAKKAEAKRSDAEDQNRFDERVKQRVELLGKAREVLDSVDVKATDRQLKEAVIEKLTPGVDLSERSDEYVDARFDAACEFAKPSEGLASVRKAAEERKTDSSSSSKKEDARAAMLKRNQERGERKEDKR